MKQLSAAFALLIIIASVLWTSCRNAASSSALVGSWRIDSITHPTDQNKALMANMMMTVVGGRGGLRYEFTKDSMFIRLNNSVAERMHYSFRNGAIYVKDTLSGRQRVQFISNDRMIMTSNDSLRVHLQRVATPLN